MNSRKKTVVKFHSKNVHNKGYDLSGLVEVYPELAPFLFTNKFGDDTIDFSNSKAVKALNTALLKCYYNIQYWKFPDENLCPPIPGRVDYIHYLNDLISSSSITNPVEILDIGTGATCIYPLLGYSVFGWKFTGTDVDTNSIKVASKILENNKLDEFIELKFQGDATQIFNTILNGEKKYTATMCNPPFYRSAQEAQESNLRKLKGLNQAGTTGRNFSGSQNELWYKGGEKAFLHTYLYESSQHPKECFWYTSLVSKKENVKSMYDSLKKLGATQIKTIPMHQGNKVTRIVAWTFLNDEEQQKWSVT